MVTEAVNAGLPVKQLGDPVFFEPLAVVMDKGDADLNAKLAEVVEAMKDDGTLAALSVKFHGVDLVTTK